MPPFWSKEPDYLHRSCKGGIWKPRFAPLVHHPSHVCTKIESEESGREHFSEKVVGGIYSSLTWGSLGILSPHLHMCPLESGVSAWRMTDSWKIQMHEAKAVYEGQKKGDCTRTESQFCLQKGACIVSWTCCGSCGRHVTWGRLNKNFAPEVPLEGWWAQQR